MGFAKKVANGYVWVNYNNMVTVREFKLINTLRETVKSDDVLVFTDNREANYKVSMQSFKTAEYSFNFYIKTTFEHPSSKSNHFEIDVVFKIDTARPIPNGLVYPSTKFDIPFVASLLLISDAIVNADYLLNCIISGYPQELLIQRTQAQLTTWLLSVLDNQSI